MRKQITGRLERVERRQSSRYGNPRFAITVDGRTRLTEVDGSVGYAVTNYRVGREVSLTVEGRSIIDMTLLGGRRMSAYGWTITADLLGDEPGAVGTMGPRDITSGHAAALVAGEGRTFTLYDDDGEAYYRGRLIADDYDDEESCYGPLGDFGGPNAGATEIRYRYHPEMDCG